MPMKKPNPVRIHPRAIYKKIIDNLQNCEFILRRKHISWDCSEKKTIMVEIILSRAFLEFVFIIK